MSHTVLDHLTTAWRKTKKPAGLVLGAGILITIVYGGTSFALAQAYEDRLYPNISVGSLEVGSLSKEEALDQLEYAYEGLLDDGLTIFFEEGTRYPINLRTSGATDPDLIYNLIDFNPDRAMEEGFSIGHTGSWLSDGSLVLRSFLIPKTLDPQMTLLDEELEEILMEQFGENEIEGQNTDYAVEFSGDDLTITITEGTEGLELDINSVIVEIRNEMTSFKIDEQFLPIVVTHAVVETGHAEAMLEDVEAMILAAPYALTHTSSSQREYTWTITRSDLADWIYPLYVDEDQTTLALDEDALIALMDEIGETINIEPTDARFTVEEGRVTEFKGSLDGVTLDAEATIDTIVSLLGEEEVRMEVITEIVEPEITTGSVNDLGISEILGVGTSDFSGSPYNRVQNITHGADKLAGMLIPPGETLSLIETLGPFTSADGYLPELVIKGDEIKPEIGGGLCQIGTTTFRAVMNAGLQIDERRNHSLVVSYYDDPSNGNPGTDATLYDPAPDFKFTNDTENYILLTTEVDLTTYELYFTFWGTDDGREGYYTAPVVDSWLGYGETQYIDTEDLDVGVTKCQSPHSGATTSFTYYVDYEDGTQHEKLYSSTYRSLPRICLVGVDPDAPVEGEEGSETTGEEETGEELEVGDVEPETEE